MTSPLCAGAAGATSAAAAGTSGPAEGPASCPAAAMRGLPLLGSPSRSVSSVFLAAAALLSLASGSRAALLSRREPSHAVCGGARGAGGV